MQQLPYKMPRRGFPVPVLSPREQEEKAKRDKAARMAKPSSGQGFSAPPKPAPKSAPSKAERYFAKQAETRRQQSINNRNRRNALDENNKRSILGTRFSDIAKDSLKYLDTPLEEIQAAKNSGPATGPTENFLNKPISDIAKDSLEYLNTPSKESQAPKNSGPALGPVERLLQKQIFPPPLEAGSYDKAVPVTPPIQRPALQHGQELDGFGEPYTPGGPLKMDGFDPNPGGFTVEGYGSFRVPSSASEGGVYSAGVDDIMLPSAAFTPYPNSGSHQNFPITETGKFLRRERQRRDAMDIINPVPTVESSGLLANIAEQSPRPVPRSRQPAPPSLDPLATEFATEPGSPSNLPMVPESLEQAATSRTSPPTPFLPVQPNFIDRTKSYMQRPVLPNEMMPYEQTGRVPMSPRVNESFIFPSRSERNRSSMQPGGMGDGSVFDRLRQRDADRVSAANARPMASTQNEVDSDSFQHHYGPDVTSDVKAFVNTGRELNSAAGRDFRKQLNQGLDGNLAARKAARLSGGTYTDPHTGAMTDYGKFNEYRERLAEGPTFENMSDQRKLRMRRAQLMNYGRTGGVTVAPGGGIAGPMTVGTQATFGPNMSLNQATRMAQGQLNQESRLRDAESKLKDQERIEGLKYLASQGDSEAGYELREQLGVPFSEEDRVMARHMQNMPQAPRQTGPITSMPLEQRAPIAFQVYSIANNPGMTDAEKKTAILDMHPDLGNLRGINALQDGTSYDQGFGGDQGLLGTGDYEMTEDLKRIMGITDGTTDPVATAAPRPPALQGIAPSMFGAGF